MGKALDENDLLMLGRLPRDPCVGTVPVYTFADCDAIERELVKLGRPTAPVDRARAELAAHLRRTK